MTGTGRLVVKVQCKDPEYSPGSVTVTEYGVFRIPFGIVAGVILNVAASARLPMPAMINRQIEITYFLKCFGCILSLTFRRADIRIAAPAGVLPCCLEAALSIYGYRRFAAKN